MYRPKLKIFTNTLFVIFFFVTIQGFLFVANAEAKVGYINLQRLVTESQLGQDARTIIKRMRLEKENLVLEKLQQIKRMRSQFEDNKKDMSVENQRETIEQIQQANKEYKRLVDDSKEAIAREDRELVTIILQKADTALKEIAKKKKFSIILKDPNAVAFIDEKVDITDEIIKALNKN